MGHVEVSEVTYVLPDGRLLLNDVSFRVGEGVVAALVGPNGAGKTTLLRLVAGELVPAAGRVASSGGIGVMGQFIGGGTIRDLLLSVAPRQIRAAAEKLGRGPGEDEASQLAYAGALADYDEAGGYALEVVWDVCVTAALGLPYELDRAVDTLSGGERKRLMLEALLRGPDETLLLDEPDNYLDVPGKQWLERQLQETSKTILLVSHDRQLLANAADRIITVESRNVWIHGGGFATYTQGRADRIERLDELRRRWDGEHARLRRTLQLLRQNEASGEAIRAARTRLDRFEEAGPPQAPPRRQNVRMRLRGGRTGKRAVTGAGVELGGLTRPFDIEIWYGERLAIVGSNGSGKSTFLKAIAAGHLDLGARVVPGYFVQTHARPDLAGRKLAEIVTEENALTLNEAMAALARYELAAAGRQPYETLSGGQQARLQILLLELSGATLLLLDEPTDNLDLASADALQAGIAGFQGTVLAVTHDRWFAADFDRYLVFGAGGMVYESAEPVWMDRF